MPNNSQESKPVALTLAQFLVAIIGWLAQENETLLQASHRLGVSWQFLGNAKRGVVSSGILVPMRQGHEFSPRMTYRRGRRIVCITSRLDTESVAWKNLCQLFGEGRFLIGQAYNLDELANEFQAKQGSLQFLSDEVKRRVQDLLTPPDQPLQDGESKEQWLIRQINLYARAETFADGLARQFRSRRQRLSEEYTERNLAELGQS